MISPFLPDDLSLPLAFIVGAGYLLWLARSLYALRGERASFHREMILLGCVFGIAIGVSALGLAQASLPGKLFFSLYAISIGAAFFLVQTTPRASGQNYPLRSRKPYRLPMPAPR